MMVSAQIINTVLLKAIEVATHSWEYGTVFEALLEWNNPSSSIWNDPFPGGQMPTLNLANTSALSYVKPFITLNETTLVDGDGAAGDPASLGIPALLLGRTNSTYTQAALHQRNHLLAIVPRWPNGAISHREAYPELWADFMYMVPPFLAYYGAATANVTAMKEAVQQCGYYREALVQEEQGGAWWHIVTTKTTKDHALWSTGNAWAVAGMARVLATIKKFGVEGLVAELNELVGWIKEIVDAAMSYDTESSGLLRNYLNDTEWWGEISGTSLIAATVMRMAVLEPETFGELYVEWAEKKMGVVDALIDAESGIVGPAVNPLNWHDKNKYVTGSPEGQSFVVLMHAAWRDLKGAA